MMHKIVFFFLQQTNPSVDQWRSTLVKEKNPLDLSYGFMYSSKNYG